MARTWKALHNKLVDMAKDFQEAKYGWKPHADSRTMEDEFRHVTIGLEMTTAMAKGDKFDYPARVKADATKPHAQASVVSEMEAAIAASFAVLDAGPKPLYVSWLDHQGEHYGKLVSNYRSQGMVPPVSRRSGSYSTVYPSACAFSRRRLSRVTIVTNAGDSPSDSAEAR